MSTSILINGLVPPVTNLTVGSTVTLTHNNDAGIVSWEWSLLDRPTGSAAVLSTPSLSSTTITLDKEGTYFFELIVNNTIYAPITAICAVPTILGGIRLLAANENREADPNRGSTPALDAALLAHDTIIHTGEVMSCVTDAAHAAGMPVYIAGETTLANGQLVPIVSVATSGGAKTIKTIGILTQTTVGAALSSIRVNGELTEVPVNTTGRALGDRVFVSDTGTLVFTPGTNVSCVGFVSAVGTSGRIHIQILNIDSASLSTVVLTPVGASPNSNAASVSGQILTLQPANSSNPGIITIGAQTLAGAKTFTGTLAAPNLSGTNTGDISLSTVGSAPNDSGASLSSQVLTLQPADGTHPGVVSTATQTFAGDKTFTGNVTVDGALNISFQSSVLDYLTLKVGSLPVTEASKVKLFTDGLKLFAKINGSTTRPNVRIDPWKYNVKDFGAKGDNSADDTDAINLAMFHAYADDNNGGTSGQINYFERPVVYFPPGLYKISGPLLFTYAPNIEGDCACIIQTDSSKDIFNAVNGVGFGLSGNTKFSVRGLCFVGGKDQISVDSNNTNNTILNINDCYFINPIGACLNTGPLHKGLTTVSGCFIWTNDSGRVGSINGGDETIFENCYAAVGASVSVFQITNQVGFKLNNFVGTPGSPSGGTWVEVTGPAQIGIKRSRFGGEQGLYGVDWRSTGGVLVIEDLSGPYFSGHPGFRFFNSPDYVDISLEDAGGTAYWFDPSMPDADKRQLGNIHWRAPGLGDISNPDITGGPFFLLEPTTDPFCLQQVTGRAWSSPRSKLIQTSDYIQAMEMTLQSNFDSSSSSNNVANVSGTTIFGTPNYAVQATSSPANAGIVSQSWLKNLPNGEYTLVVDMDVTAPTLIILYAQSDANQRSFLMTPGDPSPHFYFNVGSPTTSFMRIGISGATILNGATWTVNRIRLYKGRVRVPDTKCILHGATAPVAGYFQPGDEIRYLQPIPGGAIGLICVSAGFAVRGNWTTNTVYTRGDHVQNLGSTFLCVQGGTSAGAGPGPNSSIFPNTDNTVLWAFMKTIPPAVFKEYGLISL